MIFSKEKFSEVVDFSHRLNPISFYDNISQSLDRAKAIADFIETVASAHDCDALEPESLRFAAQAIRYSIEDAQAMLEAYSTNHDFIECPLNRQTKQPSNSNEQAG